MNSLCKRATVLGSVGIPGVLFLSGLALGQTGVGAAGQATQPAQTQPSTAPRKDLPEAKLVVEAALEAMGGREAFDAIDTQSVKIVAVSPYGESSMDIKANKKDGFLVVQESPMGQGAVGSDGETGWQRDTNGYELVAPEHLKDVRKELDVFLFRVASNPAKYFETMETVDRVPLEGKEAYKVRMLLKDEPESEQFWFFDVEEKLLARIERSIPSPVGAVPTAMIMSDWKKFDSIKLYTKVRMQRMGMEASITYTEVQFNNVEAPTFELPAEVKELLKGQQTAPSTQPAPPATKPATPTTQPEAPPTPN